MILFKSNNMKYDSIKFKNNISITDVVGDQTEVFWWLMGANKRYIVSSGGSGSSKTYSALQRLLLLAITEKAIITVVSCDIPALRGGAIRDTANIIANSEFLKSQVVRYNRSTLDYLFKSGSILEFKSYENSFDARNGKRTHLFINEANSVSEEIYNELEIRTSRFIILDYNPTFKFWANTKYDNHPDAVTFISNFTNNQFVSPAIVKSLLHYKDTNPMRWRVMGLGLCGHTEGTIYTRWRVSTELFPKEYERKLFCYVMDFGFRQDPTALLRVCVHNGKVYVEELVYKLALTDSALIREFEKWKISKNDLIIADSANPQSIATLSEVHGYYVVGADKPKDSILAGIALLQDVDIVVVGNSQNVVTELENYSYDKKDGVYLNKPIEKFNHALDALRYWALRYLGQPEWIEYVPCSEGIDFSEL